MAEKSWASAAVRSIALELRDRLPGSAVHVDDVIEHHCDQCKHGKGDFRMAAADLLDLVSETPGRGFERVRLPARYCAEGVALSLGVFTPAGCDSISGR